MPIRAHVLSVQDNDGDTRLLEEIWGQDTEIKLTCRTTGVLGMEHLQTEDQRVPNLILLAGLFPLSQMSTLDVLVALKADPQLRHIPVLVFAALDPGTINSFYMAHAACVIALPSDFGAFSAMLAQAKSFWLGHARLPGETQVYYRPLSN